MATNILALLLPCQLLRLPQVPFSSAVYHIHSPEHFLEAHGLAPPGACVTETFRPVGVRGDHVIAFNVRTGQGRMSGRMFSEGACTSHIVLLDEDDRVCLLAQLSVKPDGVAGVSIRVSTGVARRVGGWDPATALVRVSPAAVRAAILAGGQEGAEDANLLLYRRRVLRPPRVTI